MPPLSHCRDTWRRLRVHVWLGGHWWKTAC